MNNNISARELAVIALSRVLTDGSYSNITLNSLFKEYWLSNEDKSFCASLFYGTLDRKITIDYILKQFINSGFNRIKPYTMNVLRSAVYQIKFMDKIPDSAAVNEAVRLIKKSKESFNSGFVNAVLRNILREGVILPSGSSYEDLSIKYSCSERIVKELINDYGLAFTEDYLASSLNVQNTYFCVNNSLCTASELSLILQKDGVTVNETVLPNSLKVSGYSSVEGLSAYIDGLFYVQDIACTMAVKMLSVSDNDTVLDLCSAPGGKAFTASLSADNVKVTATDLYENRVSLIKKGAERLKLKNFDALCLDATIFDDNLGRFDKIICDVPCSGFGVIGRKPEIKYKNNDDYIQLCKIQYAILANADNYLKSGGTILYSTCTLRKLENEDIVNAFLASHKDYSLLEMRTFLPSTDCSDGFFAAVLKKG